MTTISPEERKRLNNVLGQIRNRCTNPNNHRYNSYGARGITYDPDLITVEGILKEIGPRPSPAHSIDRIDNDGSYVRGNIRWATAKEQARNRRSTIFVNMKGETMCLSDLAQCLGVPRWKLYQCLSRE